MSTAAILKKYITENGIKQTFIAEKAGMSAELLRRSLEGKRVLKADEFIVICIVLSLDLDYFKALRPAV